MKVRLTEWKGWSAISKLWLHFIFYWSIYLLLRPLSPRSESTNDCTAVYIPVPLAVLESQAIQASQVFLCKIDSPTEAKRGTPGSVIHVREYSKTFNTEVNWPPAALPAVSPNTRRQKRERSQVSPLLWYRIRVTAPPVKPCKHDYNAKEAAILHSSKHSGGTISHMILVGKNHKGTLKMFLPFPQHLTMSQLSRGVTPGLPGSPLSPLAPAMPGTPGNPWEQPSPQPPWRNTQQVSCPRNWHGKKKKKKKIGRKFTGLNVTPPPRIAFVTLNLHHLQQSLGVAAGVHWGSAGRGRGLHAIFYVPFLLAGTRCAFMQVNKRDVSPLYDIYDTETTSRPADRRRILRLYSRF